MSPKAESQVPLLPEGKLTTRSGSVPGAVFNISTSIIGAGIMSIPATIKVLGVIPAFILIAAVAWLVDISVEFLMRFTHTGSSMTYAGVMKESFGTLASVAVQICVMIASLGCLIIYLIIIGDVLSGNHQGGSVHLGVLQEWFGIQWWNSREFALLFILVIVMLPLVLLRHVDSLRFSSAISVLLAVVFVAVSSVLAIYALVEGKAENPRWFPRVETQASFFDLFTAVPVIVTAFTFHFNVHHIGFELGKPSDMLSAVRVSLILCSGIYFVVGVCGYLLFGDSVMPDILINFDRSSASPSAALLNDIVRLSYALHLMLVFPLLNFCLRSSIDEVLFPKKPLLSTDTTRFVSLTIVLLAVAYLAAIAFPNIWYFFQFVGSTSAVCLAFIFPGAIVLRDVHGISNLKDKVMARTMIILAIITSALAISTNIYSLLANHS
ncbi:hypothetical protein MLD38_024117 [Melastoma candidum]|uniref:Uncharacterized protein n=1 Tax=Melastoma candidum TaxID=119954 RepID=A0ACB9NT06_9MYRT|nr:hypothetical protein MLD38_024117 [Melastoma candidum]